MRGLTQSLSACYCELPGVAGCMRRVASTETRKMVTMKTNPPHPTTLFVCPMIMKLTVGVIITQPTSHLTNLDKPLCPIKLFQLADYSLIVTVAILI